MLTKKNAETQGEYDIELIDSLRYNEENFYRKELLVRNMNQRKSVFLSCLACVSILVLLLALNKLELKNKEIDYADDYDGLQIYVDYSVQTEVINIWKGKDCYYFFLPSAVEDHRVFFGNLRKGDTLTIDGQVYRQGDEVSREITFGSAYEIQFNVNGEAFPAQKVVFTRSMGMPAAFIETMSGTVENIHADKMIKEEAQLLLLNGEGECEYRGDIEYVKTRGNSNFYGTDKKSYQIKLYQKKALLGMEKEKKWILLSNAFDASMIRNKLVYDYAAEYTNVPSIDGKYVDLYMNGDYAGCYFLCEKVEISENRLNITDLEEKNEAVNSRDSLENGIQYVSEDERIRAVGGLKNPQDNTGGYLLEAAARTDFETVRCGFMTDSGQCYNVISPQNATIEQVEYVCSLFNEMEKAINQPDGVNPDTGKHFSEYIDVESWVSKYLIDEVFADPDTPAASTYLYKDSDAVDPLIYSGPVWDYDLAIGGYCREWAFLDDPSQIGYRAVYAKKLLVHDEVMEKVIEEYKSRILPYVDRELGRQIAYGQREFKASAEMDRLRWPQIDGYYTGLESNGEYLVAFLKKKVEYLSEIWLAEEQYHTVTFLDYYGSTYEVYHIKHGEYLTIIPDIATYVAVFNGWHDIANGKSLDIRRPILEDVTYQSSWIEASILLQNGLDAADIDVENIDIDALEMLVTLIKERREEEFE